MLPYRPDERKEVFPVLVKSFGEVRMKRTLISTVCVMLFAGVAFGQAGTATIWLEGDSGGNQVTVAVDASATVEVWFEFSEDTRPGAQSRMIGIAAQLRHNAFDNTVANWDNRDGTAFQATALNYGGPWGNLPRPLAGDPAGHGGLSSGVLPTSELAAGNLNPGVVGLGYQLAAGSGAPFDLGSGLTGSGTSWHGDTITIEGLVENWDTDTLTGTPDTVNFPKKTSGIVTFSDNTLYGGAWVVSPIINFAQGQGAAGNRIHVRVTPEPTSLALLAIGGLAALRRRR